MAATVAGATATAELRPRCPLQRTLRPRESLPCAREGARTCREPLYVLSLERYAKDPSSALFFPQAASASEWLYDATLSDGDCRVRVTLHPWLNAQLETNALRCGCRVRDVTFCADGEARGDRAGGASFRVLSLAVDAEAGADAALEALSALRVDSLAWFGSDGEAPPPPLVPLRARRSCYVPLWNEQDYSGAAWSESESGSARGERRERGCGSGEAPDEPREPAVTLHAVRRAFRRRGRAVRGALVVRVLRKSRLVFYGKAESSCECPYKAVLEVADRSGRAAAVLWNSLCVRWYRSLRPGLVLRLSGYRVKESYGARAAGGPPQDDIEISLNSRNPSARICVISPPDVLAQWSLPDTPYAFRCGSELLTCPAGTICDVIGLVVFAGRPERIRSRDGAGAGLCEYRWLRLEDGTTAQPIAIQLFSTSQPEIQSRIYPMSILVCTNVQVVRSAEGRAAPSRYLTNTSFTQVYCTGSGHHCSMPYRQLRSVRSFLQWLHTVDEGHVLSRALTGGYFAFPPLPVSLEHFLKEMKGDPGLLSGEELRRETEKLQYRESRGFAIQATVTSVSYSGLGEGEEHRALRRAVIRSPSASSSSSVCVQLGPTSPELQVAVGSLSGHSGVSPRKRLFGSMEHPRKRLPLPLPHAQEDEDADTDFSLWEASMEFLQEDAEDSSAAELIPSDVPQGPRLGSVHAFRETVPRAFCPLRRVVQAAAIGLQAERLQDTLPCRKLDTFAPAPRVYSGHYTLTLRAAPGNPHWCPHPTPHNNTWESILSHGGFSPSVPPPAPSDLMGSAPQLGARRLMCVLQVCHLGSGQLEVVLRCAYPLRD
ncbi:RPA-related protein RADX isoform X2 [Scleropages formosus]|uniref:RPA-related protein RADX isoform X2 n=1 Tax=Scleropages formosus TaxID=113540 RepID=UPI0010FA95CE|nr:RPA-related protein RADX-like isoform X2 [Scleropages formosus]